MPIKIHLAQIRAILKNNGYQDSLEIEIKSKGKNISIGSVTSI